MVDSYEPAFGHQVWSASPELFLSNGFHNLVDRQDNFRAGNGPRRRTARSIQVPETHGYTFEAGDGVVGNDDLCWLREKAKLDAFLFREIVLMPVGAHLQFRAAVNNCDAPCS